MTRLKKKINIILFSLCLKSELFILLVPFLYVNKDKQKLLSGSHGIRYLFSKNKILCFAASNISYFCLNSKQEFSKNLMLFNSVLFGVKIKNLYFSVKSLAYFNYLNFFEPISFLMRLRFLYIYFISFFFKLKKKLFFS